MSKQLAKEYEKIAKQKRIHFLAASDYAVPSETDQEHMDEANHAMLAQAVLEKIWAIL